MRAEIRRLIRRHWPAEWVRASGGRCLDSGDRIIRDSLPGEPQPWKRTRFTGADEVEPGLIAESPLVECPACKHLIAAETRKTHPCVDSFPRPLVWAEGVDDKQERPSARGGSCTFTTAIMNTGLVKPDDE